MKKQKISFFLKLFSFLKSDTNNYVYKTEANSSKINSRKDLKEIEENKKINLHIKDLIEVNDYKRVISLFEHLPPDKLNIISTENYKGIVKKVIHLFTGHGVNLNSQEAISLMEFSAHPVISQQIADTINTLKTESHKIYDTKKLNDKNSFFFKEILTPLKDNKELFINTTRKLFKLDYENNRLIYNGLSSLTENEKKLLEISFRNLHYNLSKNPSKIDATNQMFLLCEDYSLLAFLIEHPEFQGNQMFIDKKPWFTYSFSNKNSLFAVILKSLEQNIHIPNSLFFDMASEIFEKELTMLTLNKKVLNEHDEILSTLEKRYGDQTSYLIKNANLSEQLFSHVNNVFNELQEWKNSIGPNGDKEILSFIDNSNESLKSALIFYKEFKSFNTHQASADKLIIDLLHNITNTMGNYSEQTIENLVNQNKQIKSMH